jgi:hypothetical protein
LREADVRGHVAGSFLFGWLLAALLQGFPGAATFAFAQAAHVTLVPVDARGTKFQITGTELANAKVLLCPAEADRCDRGVAADAITPAADGTSLTFSVPPSVAAGRYRIEIDGKPFGTVAVAALPVQVTSLTPAPTNVQRGATVTINGSGLAAPDLFVDLCAVDTRPSPAGPAVRAPAPRELQGLGADVLDRSGTALKFVVPQTAALGSYRVQVRSSASTTRCGPGTYAGDLAVVPPAVDLTNVVPAVPFPDATRISGTRTFTLTVMGSGFSVDPHSRENILLFEDMPALIACDPPRSGETRPEHSCTEGFVAQGRRGGREVVFAGIPYEYRGIRKVRIQVGDLISPPDPRNAKVVTFSPYGEGVPLGAAIVITVLLAFAVYGLMSTSRERRARPFMERLSTWFVDPETNSYSLSKFQFYAWTLAAVLGYLYLSAARSLVQGSLELSPVPEGLATLLATAAGTTVIASGITNAKGPKGTGDAEPSFADFFTQAGIVAPERFQFFIWTVIGVVSFLALTLLHPPAEIQTLPKIPTEFLTLTGISAAGYLGGKLAWPSGPTIATVVPDPKDNPTHLVVTGSMLPTVGTYTLRDLEEEKDIDLPLTKNIAEKEPDKQFTVVTREEGSAGTDRAKSLSIKLPAGFKLEAPKKWPEKKRYRLTIFDTDKHKAEGDF